MPDSCRSHHYQTPAGTVAAAQLAEHITPDEIESLAIRAIVVAESATMPHPPGHRPIPWPPF